MGLPQKLGWNVYTGALGLITTLVTTRLLAMGWRTVTGEEPPAANDPETSTKQAMAWLVTGGLGLAMAQLLVNRFAANRWKFETGQQAPSTKSVNVKI